MSNPLTQWSKRNTAPGSLDQSVKLRERRHLMIEVSRIWALQPHDRCESARGLHILSADPLDDVECLTSDEFWIVCVSDSWHELLHPYLGFWRFTSRLKSAAVAFVRSRIRAHSKSRCKVGRSSACSASDPSPRGGCRDSPGRIPRSWRLGTIRELTVERRPPKQ